jgi:hypothetical protein
MLGAGSRPVEPDVRSWDKKRVWTRHNSQDLFDPMGCSVSGKKKIRPQATEHLRAER